MSDELVNVVQDKLAILEKKLEVLERTFDVLRNQLSKEMYMWRSIVVFLLFLFIGITTVGYFFDQRQHSADNKERARHWTITEDALTVNKDLILRNTAAIFTIDEHLRQCSGCHSHPDIKR